MTREAIIHLMEQVANYEGVSHWTLSQRIFGKGNFFDKLLGGGDCYSASLERAHRWFHENWPEDLEWPDEIERPAKRLHLKEAS